MAEFCSQCEPKHFDIDLFVIAVEIELGHSYNFICEGCNVRSVYKDETGKLFLGKLINGELKLEAINIEEL